MLTIIVLTLVVFTVTLVCTILKLESCSMRQLLRITTTVPYHTSWQCFVFISLLSSSLHNSNGKDYIERLIPGGLSPSCFCCNKLLQLSG